MRRACARWSILPLLLGGAAGSGLPSVGHAAEVTDVASSFDTDNPFDFRLRVGYLFTTKQGAIKREHEGPGQDQVVLYKDLVYQQTRHEMSLRAEAGIYKDLSLVIEMPLVISDQRELSYDQRLGGECIYSGSDANCVNAGNSTTTNSGLTDNAADSNPTHYIVPAGGFDAQSSGMGFNAGSDMVFRGPKRGGSGNDLLDTVNFGLNWAALSQKRDDTKPTWMIGAEYRLSVGNVMQFDRSRPDANHGVADGLDHFHVRTAVSRRFRWVDPYVTFWYDLPILRRNDTLFKDYGAREKNAKPQMSAGTVFGLEGVPWEQPEKDYKIVIDLNARISGHFDGRGYSEIWEMLASSPAMRCEADPNSYNYNKACDAMQVGLDGKPVMNAYQGKEFTGLTVIENYASIGAEFALLVQAGKYVRFRASFLYNHDQAHFITSDDVGKPNPGNNRVTGADEFNPAFRPIVNDPGRRYQVDSLDTFRIGVWGQVMF